MGLFLRSAVATQDEVESTPPTPSPRTTASASRWILLLTTILRLPLKYVEHVLNSGIEHRLVEQMRFVVLDKDSQDLMKMLGVLDRQGMCRSKMLDTAADVGMDSLPPRAAPNRNARA